MEAPEIGDVRPGPNPECRPGGPLLRGGAVDALEMGVGPGTRIVPDRSAGGLDGTDLRPADRAVWAGIYHEYLLRYARLDAQVDRALGRLLRRLRDLDGVPKLGFGRFEDYVRERLGVTARWAQELMRLDRALGRLPVLAEARDAGRLPVSKVLALLAVVTPESEGEWSGRAPGLTVRALREEVRRGREGKGVLGATTGSAGGDADTIGSASGDRCGAGEEPEGTWVQLRAPAAVTHLFDYSIEIARRTAGAHAPVHRCVEHIVAEFFSGPHSGSWPPASGGAGKGGGWGAGAGAEAGGGGAVVISREAAAEIARREARARQAAEEERLEIHAASGSSMREPRLAISLVAALGGERVPPDPVALDAHLRRLVRFRQARHGEMARLLSRFRERRLWQKLSSASFEHYCRERLGISTRLAQELLRAERAFRVLPAIGAAYFGGRLTWAKSRLLLSICRPETQAIWLDRAMQVTARYLEREVAHARRERERDPERWVQDGGPLPLHHRPPYAADSPVRPGAALDVPAPTSSPGVGSGALPGVIRFWLPEPTERLWRLAHDTLAAAAGRPTAPWQRLLVLLEHFLRTWDEPDRRRFSAHHALLARDGYQCTAPGCLARRGLELHHVRFRSRGGSDRAENQTTLCAVHHRIGIHRGWIRCEGEAPDAITWRLPVATFRGDVRIRSNHADARA
jgi:hypothetical protein